ncbi:MAG: histidine kinase [Deltaproteobacteria bacterium]|nr:histidine kinase [Deltaproteobacteria bacterium]
MSRRMLLGAFALVACLASTWAVVIYVLDRDRDSAERELAADRLQTLDGAARSLGASLAGIGKDLTLAAALDSERELAAIAGVKREYIAIEVWREDGTRARVASAGATEPVLALARPVIARMVETARAAPGELHISRGLSSNDDLPAWHRVFSVCQKPSTAASASASPGGNGERSAAQAVTVAAVIDMRVLVTPPELLRIVSSRLLVMSAHGVPAPASDATVVAAMREEAGAPLRELVDGARMRRPGTAILDEATARRLGLPEATAVAAAMPVPIDAGTPWVLMLVTSTDTLDARHHALVRRLAIDIGAGLVLVLIAAAYVIRNARRAAALRERLRHAEVLAHLTEKAEKILDHIPSGVLALDERGLVSACNRSLGAGGERRVGRTLAEAFGDAPREHVAAVAELVAAARAAGASRTLRRARLALFGDEACVTVHAIPLAHVFRDVATLLVFDDESAVQRAEERLLRSEKLATAGQLAAGIAHEVGTPLGVARGRAEMILLRGRADEADARNLRTIVERIDHVSHMIEQLLDYLHPRAAQLQRVDTSASLRFVADLLEPRAAAREVRLAIDAGDARAASVRADPGQLQQVLVNLVMNAIDACDPGGRVTMRARPRPGVVVLEVADDGRGIALADRAHVFDPFFTTKKRGHGTGLGLWVVAQVVRAHDAEIEVDCEGAGCTFRIVWPAAEKAA